MRPETTLKTYPSDDMTTAASKKTQILGVTPSKFRRKKSATAGEANEAAEDIEIGEDDLQSVFTMLLGRHLMITNDEGIRQSLI